MLRNPLAVYEIKEQKLSSIITNLNNLIKNKLLVSKTRYNHIISSYILNNPEDLFKKDEHAYKLLINKLELLNPVSILSKGYSIVKIGDKVIKSEKEVKNKDTVNIKLFDGEFSAEVRK